MKIICIGCSMALWVTVVLADLTVVQHLETSATFMGFSQDSAITMKMKGQKARIDFSGMPISSIVDLKARKVFFLDHELKLVMVMPLELMQTMVTLSGLVTNADQDQPAIQKTGKVQTINGYTCEEYTGTSNGGSTLRCWIANIPEASEMEPFRIYAQDAFKATSLGCLAAMPGLIVRSESTIVTNKKPVTSRTEFQSLSRAPIADAVFSVPTDYTPMGMPSLPAP